MSKIYRQGDVLVKKIEKLPKRLKKLDTDVIVMGEATGHAHRLQNGSIYIYGSQMYLEVYNGGALVHEEHSPIELEPGIYEVIRQREFDPITKRDPWVID
ncbi:MAG: hypothetical protein ACFFCM_07410 [Promethearchaeota archaeon]